MEDMSLLHVRQDSNQVTAELMVMVDDADFSDVQFLCKDGVKVHACRLLLAARSPVLKKMLTNGMVESRLTEIPLPNISSSALVPTFEFIYTGGIMKRQFTFGIGLEVLQAAQYLMLEALKHQVASLLAAAVEKVTSQPALVGYLAKAADLGCCDEVVRHIAVSLEKVDGSWGYVKEMSLNTMQVYFRVSGSLNEEPALSLMEYLRLRQILLWSSSQVSPEAQDMMTYFLPTEELFIEHFNCLKTSDKSYAELFISPFLYTEMSKLVAQIQELGIEWSHVVRLQYIHPVLLYTVIKPLGVIPSALFEAAFRYQGCHLGDMSVMKWVVKGEDYMDYETLDNGTVLLARRKKPTAPLEDLDTDTSSKRSGTPSDRILVRKRQLPQNPDTATSRPSVVRANMAFIKRTGTYVFEVVIEEAVSDMIIGVGTPAQCRSTFSEEDLPVHLRSGTGTAYFHKSCRVRVNVDRTNLSCRFYINGQLSRSFTNISQEVVPFARCSRGGEMRILLVSDAQSM